MVVTNLGEERYRQALARNPRDAVATEMLGVLAHQQGRHGEAMGFFQKAIELDGSVPDYHNNLGTLLARLRKPAEAIKCFEAALRLAPRHGPAQSNLAAGYRDVRRLDDSLAAFERAIELHSRDANVHASYAHVLEMVGRAGDAVAAYRRSLALRPDRRLHSALLFCLHNLPESTPQSLCTEHVAWAKAHAQEAPASERPRRHSTSGPIRLGYLSPNLRRHPVATFLLPVLAHHDTARFHVTLYSDTGRGDDLTARLRNGPHIFRDITSRADDAVFKLIRDDGIDILVDVCGHMPGHRLRLFARRPAPLQVAWMGYPNTSGLSAIDYRITDPVLDPPEVARSYHTEKLIYLPGWMTCYCPEQGPDAGVMAEGRLESAEVDAEARVEIVEVRGQMSEVSGQGSEVDRQPDQSQIANRKSQILFGCLNRPNKLNPPLIGQWCRILRAVPGSRLALMVNSSQNSYITGLFAREGIDLSRLELLCRMPRRRYLDALAGLDVALDSFPYAGHTTTCDALWMGVPVVTMYGRTAVSRMGLDIMTRLGLSDLVADTAGGYVEIAASLARDSGRRGELRRSLRDRVARSGLGDAGAFTRQLEGALLEAWEDGRAG